MEWPANRRAIDELVNEHYLAAYRFAYRLTGTAADAEDLTQEAFCQAQMNWHQLRDPDRAKPWLFSIVRNGYLRRQRDEKPMAQLPADVECELDDPELEIDSAKLQEALNQLPEGFRTPVILYYFEEFGYRAIAEQMDLPIGTVMSRLSRAKAFLRERLVPHGERS